MSSRRCRYRDYIGIQFQTFVDQRRKPIAIVVCRQIADVDRPSRYIAEVLQALEKPVKSRRPCLQVSRIKRQKTEPWDSLRFLPLANARRGKQKEQGKYCNARRH